MDGDGDSHLSCLPSAPVARTVHGREGTDICQVEGTWHAWTPACGCGCGYAGTEDHGGDEGELAAKLAETLPG
jgi:hypothetical protein